MRKPAILLVILSVLLGGIEVHASGGDHKNPEILDWKKVDQLLPRYSIYTVIDVETRKQFKVQRRAGSHHADVQPLTSKDTAIMKEIYGGEWSWRRRAIIVKGRDHKIAASMHGMPHGGGALKNNFPGHFCIHFYGSTTHRTNKMDLSHKLMILKASNNLDRYLNEANPYEVVEAYIAGFKQQDSIIISKASLQNVNWKPILRKVESVEITHLEMLSSEELLDDLSIEVPIEISLYMKNSGRNKFRGVIQLVRFSPMDTWKVDSIPFLESQGLHTKNHLY